MKRYYRIMLGARSVFADICFDEGFIGADFLPDTNLSGALPENWREFNHQFIPVFLEKNPEKSRVAAGLACGMLHTVSRGASKGDIVVSPDGGGKYKVGEIASEYFYVPGAVLPHRRKVNWFAGDIERSAMTEKLQRSAGSIGTVSEITKYAEEIETFISGEVRRTFQDMTDASVEDPSEFALEKHLEDFLVKNWGNTELGKNYDIFSDAGELIGQQYPTDTGPIDILALRKDGKEILVIELKKGRASDSVVGQIQRYMGYILSEVAEQDQVVRGCIIALEDDLRVRYALKINPSIDFYRYQLSFKLLKQ